MAGNYCNPLNLSYRYQFNQKDGGFVLNREAADPSLILYKDKYYLFPSMSRGFWRSEDLINWQYFSLKNVPVYDYAPDVRVIGEYMYFSASRNGEICDFFRTKEPETGEFEKIEGTFDFWDPNLFLDDDGRLYFYWGCSNMTPIWGVELDPETMKPLSERIELIHNHKTENGYERVGEDHFFDIKTTNIYHMMKMNFANQMGCSPDDIDDLEPIIAAMPEEQQQMVRVYLSDNPYIEGAWMTKHNGRYYLQYACTGAEYNVYGDGVYVSDKPLGPFTLASNNPYSYNPGGFLPGAGHGSTLEDKFGNFWHASTMRISVNHPMERRVGLWPAGFDEDGELFCNQRYSDWPRTIAEGKINPWQKPKWMLLSYGKKVTVSSGEETAANLTDENVRTIWKATAKDGQWACVDLGEQADVSFVQINFADDFGVVELPEGADAVGDGTSPSRYIEEHVYCTCWKLEGSLDGDRWEVLADKSHGNTDLPHDLIEIEEGMKARYIRVTFYEFPYQAMPCLSAIRVFGTMDKEKPAQACDVQAVRLNPMDMKVTWTSDVPGAMVLWGLSEEKLYHSYMVYGQKELTIKALVAGEKEYFVRVDVHNERGITEGKVIRCC